MALKVPKIGLPQLLKDGYKVQQGLEEAVYKNIEACKQLSHVIRSSIGPNGMNKMVINHLEKLFVTNDSTTILRELEVVHPAAKMLVLASQAQKAEIGDGTNLVIALSGEMLDKAEKLLRMGLCPADIIDGYDRGLKEVYKMLDDMVVREVTDFSKVEEIAKAVRPVISAKQHGYEEFLSGLVSEAITNIMPKNPSNFNVDSVRVAKIMGANITDSTVLRGMIFGREAEGNIKAAKKAKICVLNCALDVQHTETKGTVLIKSADQMLGFSKGEEKMLESQVKELADAGIKVIITGSGVGELAIHFCDRFDIMVVKILSKFEIKRLCRVIGATALTRFGAPTAEETGYCDVVETVEIGSDRCIVFRQEEENTKTATIVLRGGTTNFLDDIERAIDDGVNIVKVLTKDGKLVAGAGASEIEIAKRLHSVAEKTPGLAQYALRAMAEAFEVIPRCLAEIAGFDGTKIISQLYAAHSSANGSQNIGINIDDLENPLLDAVNAGILDSVASKSYAIKLAVDAAITVLKVDQIIMSKPAGGPKVPQQQQGGDDDD